MVGVEVCGVVEEVGGGDNNLASPHQPLRLRVSKGPRSALIADETVQREVPRMRRHRGDPWGQEGNTVRHSLEAIDALEVDSPSEP